jgi:hypothetical protein
MPETVEAREAAHGQRMIEVRVRFWTNNIVEGKGKVLPKHAWGAGVVRLEPNSAHGISSGQPLTFNSLLELPWRIERLVREQGIVLHLSNQERKYRTDQRG